MLRKHKLCLQDQHCGTIREIVWVQINLHIIWKKCYLNLHVTTKPRIHASNNTTLFDVLSIYNDLVINQSLQIEIGIQYTDNISKILRNYSQKFKEDASTMLKKWDLHINKGTTEEFAINRYNNVKYCEAFLTTVNV